MQEGGNPLPLLFGESQHAPFVHLGPVSHGTCD